MRVKLRKYENSLVISGRAAIAFAVWNAAKFFMFVLMTPEKAEWYYGLEGETTAEKMVKMIVAIILLGIDLRLHYKVGRGAISEGASTGKKRRYMGSACFTLFYSVVFIAIEVFSFCRSGELDVLVTALIDITSANALLAIVVNTVRVRRLRRQICN